MEFNLYEQNQKTLIINCLQTWNLNCFWYNNTLHAFKKMVSSTKATFKVAKWKG